MYGGTGSLRGGMPEGAGTIGMDVVGEAVSGLPQTLPGEPKPGQSLDRGHAAPPSPGDGSEHKETAFGLPTPAPTAFW